VLIVWIILFVDINLVSPIPLNFEGIVSNHVLVFAYFFLILAIFLWTYGSSMLAIYRAGKLPYQLKPFTEDRTLGLKPFGTVSMRLVSVYTIFPIIVMFLQLITINVEVPGGLTVGLGSFRASDLIILGGLILVGVILFLIPLLGIHRRLQEARRQELSWITTRYTNLVQRLKDRMTHSDQSENANEKDALAGEISIVRQIESDVHRIQTWHFDLGVMKNLDISSFGTRVAALRLGEGPLLLLADHRPAPSCILIFLVDDLQAVSKGLRQKGWKPEGEQFEIPEGPCYRFNDPSGNPLALLQITRP